MFIKLISPRVTMRPMDSALKRQMAPPLSLLVLGALTPERHRVIVVDENVEGLDQPGRGRGRRGRPGNASGSRRDRSDLPDLVGITVKADTAQRSWEIAAGYRALGVPVVLGGIHPTTCPDENARHADAVVVGEAEQLWAQILAHAEQGRLKKVYRASEPPDLALTPSPRWDLITRKHYLYTNTLTIGRGCPWRCSFCYSSSPNLPAGYRHRPVANIVREVAALGDRHVMFIDDNFIASPAFARELLEALRPLGLVWHTAVSADIGKHPDILDLMAETGCKSLFIGFETLNPGSLKAQNKRQNHVEDYERTVAEIHRRGMMVDASVVFGFDGDGPGVFHETTDWLIARKVETMTAHILTPYPGTVLYERLLTEGRIFDHDLTHYNTSRVVFRPKGMPAEELRAGYLGAYRRFYSWANILRRLPDDPRRRMPYILFNLGYRKFGKVTSVVNSLGLMRGLGRLAARLSYGNSTTVRAWPTTNLASARACSASSREYSSVGMKSTSP